ncbi:MAG: carboxylesterase family protein [Deltaproteobacteria bacterium]|nr:carboxylesterase family protein [Deltaproteobacteria bacterium]
MRSLLRWWISLVFLSPPFCVWLLHAQTHGAGPKVTVKAGVLQGTSMDGQPEGAAFLGVPYAAPPLGELRWEPPRPPRNWSGTQTATHFAPACPQLPAGWLPYPVWSEDCLYLNIWTPKIAPEARLPVIVYFHGGSNRSGYSQLTPLGPTLSPLGVVVVTANYRLGPFGFFAHPSLTRASPHHTSGNYGLLDQIQTLHWVKENIARFGGNPDRITVMGQSSGAFDICLMMASPSARGLFQQAIMESGDCQSTLIEDVRAPIHLNQITGTGEGNGEQLAADLGIADGPDAIQKLRSMSAETILNGWKLHPQLTFDAIVDGSVIPEQPARIFAEGRQARIPVLVGSNADEATVFAAGATTVGAYRQYLRADSGPSANREFQLWPASSDAEVPARYLKVQNDTFAFGAWSMARAMSRIGEPAYLYLLTWADAGKRARLGACHGEELYFLGNEFPRDWTFVDGQQKFGEILRRYWTNFAKSGKPGGAGLPAWPLHDAASNQVQDLGRTIQPEPAWPELRSLQKIMQPVLTEGAK